MIKLVLKIDIDSFQLCEVENGSYNEIKNETTAFKFSLESLLDKDQLLKLSNFLNEFLSDHDNRDISLEISDKYCYNFTLPYSIEDLEQITWEVDKRVTDSVDKYLLSSIDNGETISVAVVRKEVKEILFKILKTLNVKLDPKEILFYDGVNNHTFNTELEKLDQPTFVGSEPKKSYFGLIISILIIVTIGAGAYLYKDKILSLFDSSEPNESLVNDPASDTDPSDKVVIKKSDDEVKTSEMKDENTIADSLETSPISEKVVEKKFSIQDYVLNFGSYNSLILFNDKIIVYPVDMAKEKLSLTEYNQPFSEFKNSLEIPVDLKTIGKEFNYTKKFISTSGEELENYLNQFFEKRVSFEKLVVIKRNNKFYVQLF